MSKYQIFPAQTKRLSLALRTGVFIERVEPPIFILHKMQLTEAGSTHMDPWQKAKVFIPHHHGPANLQKT